MVKEWKTVRAIVEVRTQGNLSEKQLASKLERISKVIEEKVGPTGARIRYKSFKRAVGALGRTDR